MHINQLQIGIAAKLYKCRDRAKALYGDEYPVRIQPFIQGIEQVKEKNGVDTLDAAIAITQALDDDGIAIALFMAAAVEIIEPSIPPSL